MSCTYFTCMLMMKHVSSLKISRPPKRWKMHPAGFNTAILQFTDKNFPDVASEFLNTRTITHLPRVLTEKIPIIIWQLITELSSRQHEKKFIATDKIEDMKITCLFANIGHDLAIKMHTSCWYCSRKLSHLNKAFFEVRKLLERLETKKATGWCKYNLPSWMASPRCFKTSWMVKWRQVFWQRPWHSSSICWFPLVLFQRNGSSRREWRQFSIGANNETLITTGQSWLLLLSLMCSKE